MITIIHIHLFQVALGVHLTKHLFFYIVCNMFNVTKTHSDIKILNIKTQRQNTNFIIYKQLSFKKHIGFFARPWKY